MKNTPFVVALEASEGGKHVFAVASRIAKFQRRVLHPVNVMRPAIALYTDLDFSPLNESALGRQSEILRENRSFLEQLTDLASDRLDQLTVIAGHPIYEISDSIEKTGTNLAIMGAQSRKLNTIVRLDYPWFTQFDLLRRFGRSSLWRCQCLPPCSYRSRYVGSS